MTTVMERDPHHLTRERLQLPGGVSVVTKPGVPGFPDLPPGVRELAPYVREHVVGQSGRRGVVVDASGSAGALAAVAVTAAEQAAEQAAEHAAGAELVATVLEPSAAAAVCAAEAFAPMPAVALHAGVVWDARETLGSAAADVLLLLPPADRGSERVHAEIAAAAAALRPDGTLLLALHKDRGGKRYLKDAERWFGSVETIGREKGWRIGLARAPKAADPASGAPWRSFEASGRTFHALPGVFAAGKLDPGTRILLDALDHHRVAADLQGTRVLDLGCGWGALSVWAAGAGADATGVDDDVAAVHSARRSAQENMVRVDVRHSDLDAALGENARFDVVLCNPPFHVGKQVRLDLSQAFVRAAHRRLVPGGVLWLVANRALPYEAYLDGWSRVDTVRAEGGFKVLRAER